MFVKETFYCVIWIFRLLFGLPRQWRKRWKAKMADRGWSLGRDGRYPFNPCLLHPVRPTRLCQRKNASQSSFFSLPPCSILLKGDFRVEKRFFFRCSLVFWWKIQIQKSNPVFRSSSRTGHFSLVDLCLKVMRNIVVCAKLWACFSLWPCD